MHRGGGNGPSADARGSFDALPFHRDREIEIVVVHDDRLRFPEALVLPAHLQEYSPGVNAVDVQRPDDDASDCATRSDVVEPGAVVWSSTSQRSAETLSGGWNVIDALRGGATSSGARNAAFTPAMTSTVRGGATRPFPAARTTYDPGATPFS
jgi:hypothetical protein